MRERNGPWWNLQRSHPQGRLIDVLQLAPGCSDDHPFDHRLHQEMPLDRQRGRRKMVGESSRTTCITREADRTCNCSSCLFFKRVFVFFKFEHFETRPWNMMELGFQPSAGGPESAEVWWSGSGCPIAPPWAMVVSTVFSGPRTGNGPSRRPKPMILGAYAVRDGPLGQLLFQANHAEGTRGESKKHIWSWEITKKPGKSFFRNPGWCVGTPQKA